MAATKGKDGAFKIGTSTVTFMDSWELQASVDIVDVTAYGDTFRKRIQTIKDWRVNIRGTLDRSDTQQAALLDQLEDGTLADFDTRMYTGASTYWSGSALMESWTITSEIAGKVGVAMVVQGNGALNYT